MKGFVFRHRHFGYAKVHTDEGRQVKIYFIGQRRAAIYTKRALLENAEFEREPLPVGLGCKVPERGLCRVNEASFVPSEVDGAYYYIVTFEGDGLTARLSECELWPIPDSVAETPLTKLIGLADGSLAAFRARQRFLAALRKVNQESGGIRALTASRIAIMPHQAYVVGTVIDDPLWRYILADEVGLGKTIEAGVIAHQLLAVKPDARVLVLCPGPLARQWLCEMHVSFAGRNFRLLDLHDPHTVDLRGWNLVISSMKTANRDHADALLKSNWDLVILDEAHGLLWNEAHYLLAYDLANRTKRLLLLSAVPARERELELLRLLRLIDPQRYQEGSASAGHFGTLYAKQAIIGRRMRLVVRQLEGSENGLDREQLHRDVERLLSVELLREDEELRRLHEAAKTQESVDSVIRDYRVLVDEVVLRYRISRRILKNRRARLVEASLMKPVERSLVLESFENTPLERRVAETTLHVLSSVPISQRSRSFQVVFRKATQAQCDPFALFVVAKAIAPKHPGDKVSARYESEAVDADPVADYDEHTAQLEICGAEIGRLIDPAAHAEWVGLLRVATEQASTRIAALLACLKRLRDEGNEKILIFAGALGVAKLVADTVRNEFGQGVVADFRHDLGDDEKERQVTRFRREPNCAFLISDESGGEGRNFQFANVLVHYDLPWSVAAIEQRIGRLDRIGRESAVCSYVICPQYGIERAWLSCLSDGFGVFSRSISGLEFMLRAAEDETVGIAVEGGPDALVAHISDLREACERERANDDAEAITDAASFNPRKYKVADATEGLAHADDFLESGLPGYLKTIGRPEAARRLTDEKDPNLQIWRIEPDYVSDLNMGSGEGQGNAKLGQVNGVFKRSVARDRRDLAFLSVGHPVVDALAIAVRQHLAGRWLTVRIESESVPPGRYLLACWRPERSDVDSNAPMFDRVAARLDDRRVWVAVEFDSGEALPSVDAERLAKAMMKKGERTEASGPAAVMDLLKQDAIAALHPEPERWASMLHALVDASRLAAMRAYDHKYKDGDEAHCRACEVRASDAIRAGYEDAAEYAEQLAREAAAIHGAMLQIDVLALAEVRMVRSRGARA
jgi:ATP-dependent helicase HepA